MQKLSICHTSVHVVLIFHSWIWFNSHSGPLFAMPPKKNAAPEAKPLIGRVGTNLKVGIVGLPNVGKSTFFNILTKSEAPAENFPFCTIDPNENKSFSWFIPFQFLPNLCLIIQGMLTSCICCRWLRRVPVPDERFDWLCNFYKPARYYIVYITTIFICLYILILQQSACTSFHHGYCWFGQRSSWRSRSWKCLLVPHPQCRCYLPSVP